MSEAWKFDPQIKCRSCGLKYCVFYRIVDGGDGAYSDEQYRCDDCEFSWWIDGIDS